MKPLLAILFLASLVGCATAQPTAFERSMFNVTTNFTTNVVGVLLVDTNSATTNLVYRTNVMVAYHMQPKQSAIDTIGVAASVASTSGLAWAGLAGTFLASLLYGWAELRNKRKARLVTTLGQNVETGIEVIKSQPGGEARATAFKAEIKSQQVAADVKAAAAVVAEEKVNTVEAQSAAARVNKST